MFIDDLQEEFAADFIYSMMQAEVIYEDHIISVRALRDPDCQAHGGIARKEKAYAIAHGATGKGNDQVRFELTAVSLAPEIDIIAPWWMAEFREHPGVKR